MKRLHLLLSLIFPAFLCSLPLRAEENLQPDPETVLTDLLTEAADAVAEAAEGEG
jgi:hypothetical protein